MTREHSCADELCTGHHLLESVRDRVEHQRVHRLSIDAEGWDGHLEPFVHAYRDTELFGSRPERFVVAMGDRPAEARVRAHEGRDEPELLVRAAELRARGLRILERHHRRAEQPVW